MIPFAIGVALMQAPLAAQIATPRSAACVTANDEVTRLRLGHNRAGAANAVNLPLSVSVGDAAAARCREDDAFLLAYGLARIDLASDARRSTPAQRTAMFKEALADLEKIKTKVLNRQSDRYEIFNILSLIYYDTHQFDKSIAVIDASTPLFPRMAPASLQKSLVTRGMAQAQIGQPGKAAASFDLATKNGHPGAQSIKQKMLGVR